MSSSLFSFKPSTVMFLLRSSAWTTCWTAYCSTFKSGFCDPWLDLTASLYDFILVFSIFSSDHNCSFIQVIRLITLSWRLITLSWECKGDFCNVIFSALRCWFSSTAVPTTLRSWSSKPVFEVMKLHNLFTIDYISDLVRFDLLNVSALTSPFLHFSAASKVIK